MGLLYTWCGSVAHPGRFAICGVNLNVICHIQMNGLLVGGLSPFYVIYSAGAA
jgi:hypothetical protein